MDIKTLPRAELDFNSHSYLHNSFSQQQGTNMSEWSLTQKTQSLSIISKNYAQIQIREIIAFYDQMDRNLFNDKLNLEYIYSAKDSYSNIDEIVNQRLILAKSNSSTIISGLILKNFQLIAIKIYRFDSYEFAIIKLDEYRIHHKINKSFPEQSLHLITPVQIGKCKQNYQVSACMEKGECNLYDYSRKIKISQQEAISIFKKILLQLANLHSLNIAHRDVKPQNIFYVKNKGWLLSDFGESQEYDQVESIYSLRGTKYFLMPQMKQSISKIKFTKQNLLVNDLYALVISIIVIQNFEYVQDIHDVIINMKDSLMQQCLLITNYQQLLFYLENLNTQDIKFNFNEEYFKLDSNINLIDETLYISSIMQIYECQNKFMLSPQLLEQLMQLIQNKLIYIANIVNLRNIENIGIIKNISPLTFKVCKSDVRKLNSQLRLRFISKQQIDWQVFNLDLIFTFGYSETIIFYCQELLKQNYNQKIHMKLINSLYRAEMFEEAFQQIQLFDQSLNFDQLDSDLKENYLFIISYENYRQKNINQICFEEQLQNYKIQDEQQMLVFLSQKLDENQSSKSKKFYALTKYLQQQFSKFDPQNMNILEQLMSLIKDMSIDRHEEIILNIYELQNESVELNYKSELLCDLGRMYILQNKQKEIKANYKRQKFLLLFNAESLHQELYFSIQINQIKVFQSQCQKDFTLKYLNQTINKIKYQIQNIRYINFAVYKKWILANLLIVIDNLVFFNLKSENPKLLYILNYALKYASQQNYIQSVSDKFSHYHTQAQFIFLKLKNYKRCNLFVLEHKKLLSLQARGFLQKYRQNENNFHFKNDSFYFLSQQMKVLKLQQQYMCWQYLQR